MKEWDLNNEALIKSLKDGEEEAFVHLMDTYYIKLCVYAQNLTKDSHRGQDIVQNVFIKVWEQRHKLKAGYSISNFLYRSVYNEFIDQYRKNRQLTTLEKEHLKQLDTIVKEEATEIDKLIELVNEEIQNLPPKCKAVFTMGKLEGLTYNEIAEYLGVSVKTVEMHMSKAFELIRRKVGDKIDAVLFLLFGIRLSEGHVIYESSAL